MSHGYSMYFTTKEGKFMGQWAIQSHFTKNDILDILQDHIDAFKGAFYQIKDNYDVIEVNITDSYWVFTRDFFSGKDLQEGVEYAIKNDLRMFLG